MAEKSIVEFEIPDDGPLSGSYATIVEAEDNQIGSKMLVRNTTTSRLKFRLNEDPTDVFTVSPGIKFLIGGFRSIKGKKIEVKKEATDPIGVRLNMFS